MTSLLLTISLLLHFFTFLWILVLMQKIKAQTPFDERKIKSEIEDLLVAYTEEMKDENKKVVKEIRQLKLEKEPIRTKEQQKITSPDNRLKKAAVVHPLNLYKARLNKTVETFDRDYQPPTISNDDVVETYEQSDTAKVLSLFEKGLTAEEIAKTLGLGKGEVELMIKIHQ